MFSLSSCLSVQHWLGLLCGSGSCWVTSPLSFSDTTCDGKLYTAVWLGCGAWLLGQTLDVAVKIFVDVIDMYHQLTLCKADYIP